MNFWVNFGRCLFSFVIPIVFCYFPSVKKIHPVFDMVSGVGSYTKTHPEIHPMWVQNPPPAKLSENGGVNGVKKSTPKSTQNPPVVLRNSPGWFSLFCYASVHDRQEIARGCKACVFDLGEAVLYWLSHRLRFVIRGFFFRSCFSHPCVQSPFPSPSVSLLIAIFSVTNCRHRKLD